MQTFSYPTEAVLIDAISGLSHGDIGTLLRAADLADLDPGPGTEKRWINKQRRLQTVFDGVRGRSDKDDTRRLQRLVIQLLDTTSGKLSRLPGWFDALTERLLVDGYEVRQIKPQFGPTDEPPWEWSSVDSTVSYRLLPIGTETVPLAPTISALEAELEDDQYEVAQSHYGQAVRCFIAGDLEAANGQLRSFLEDLFVQLARRHAGYSKNEPIAALQALQQKCLLPGEFDLLRGLWKLCQDKGAHPGLSTAGEAQFRLQTTTSVALFLLRHLKTGDG